jgi:uncharacterized protein YdeI (YjbR/CyaY-like superfamily)
MAKQKSERATAKVKRSPAEVPVLRLVSVDEWERWLEANHATVDAIWLEFAKKGASHQSVTRGEALDLALCYGWIDGQARSIDDERWQQRFTPRRRGSKWSRINCAKAEELIARGRMRAAGLREVEAAKADGRWEAAYDSPRTAKVPPDLAAAFDGNARAREMFDTLDSRNRYAILYRLQEVKRPETRARRIEQFVAMLARGETIHPQRKTAAKRAAARKTAS